VPEGAGDEAGRRGSPWRDLDSSSERELLLSFLARCAELGAIAAAKERSLALVTRAGSRRVLDAGCGTGADVIALARRLPPGGLGVGVDVSAEAIARARAQALAEGVSARFVRADIGALPFPTASFDGVRADRVLQHAAELDVAVAELVRVTRPGGAMVVSEATFKLPPGHPAPDLFGGARRLLPFLPVFLARAGAQDVRVERSEGAADPGADVRAVLGLPSGPIVVRVVHVVGVGPG
jgi:ubiquinone/menaquinone biosynthesis C-methylase UbiE